MPLLVGKLLPLVVAVLLIYGSWKIWLKFTSESGNSISKARITFLVIVMVAAAIVIIAKTFGF